MNILLAGKTTALSNKFVEKIKRHHKCVVYQDEENAKYQLKHVTTYAKQNNFENLGSMIQTYRFDFIIFFSHAIDGTVTIFDELEKLERFLFEARQHKIKNFIYITSNDLQRDTSEEIKETSRYIMMRACDKLCFSTARQTEMKMTILKIPYIYSLDDADNRFQYWFHGLSRDKKVVVNATDDEVTDFLCDEDLGELCSRIIDEPQSEDYKEMNLSGGNKISFSKITSQLQQIFPDIQVEYTYHTFCVPTHCDDEQARSEYGWIPVHVLQDDLNTMAQRVKKKNKDREAAIRKISKNDRMQRTIRIIVELIVLFAAALCLNRYLENNVLLNFIDFLLIYVVIMGTMNGQNAGVAAGILASAGYLFGSLQTMQWQILFYNVQNWLPFAIYFLLGSMSGYVRDKHDDEVRFMHEEYQILEQKYIFLNELYMKALESKDQFNSQIIGYKDSFGKLYGIVKKLDTTIQEEINFEAISILEEMLENHTVAIYSINQQSGYARLEVASKAINEKIGKSIRLADYGNMMVALEQNQLYINTDCQPGIPIYAAPICRDGQLIASIFLMEVPEKQMQMEFSNKFMIICHLVEDSLVRAMEYTDMENNMYEGTRVLKTKKFLEILAIKKDMRAQEYLDFILIHIIQDGKTLAEISSIVERLIRNTDLIGVGEDEQIYLLLNQTSEQSLVIIEQRLQENGIRYEIAEV